MWLFELVPPCLSLRSTPGWIRLKLLEFVEQHGGARGRSSGFFARQHRRTLSSAAETGRPSRRDGGSGGYASVSGKDPPVRHLKTGVR